MKMNQLKIFIVFSTRTQYCMNLLIFIVFV